MSTTKQLMRYNIANKNGKQTTYDKFEVEQILYEDGKIVAISIKNVTKKVRAFLYDGRKDKKDGK